MQNKLNEECFQEKGLRKWDSIGRERGFPLNRRKALPRSKKARTCFAKNREIRYRICFLTRKKRNQEIENSV